VSKSTESLELLKAAGINDVAAFYLDRFFAGGVLDARYFDPIYRFDINYARTMWIYDNVRPGSSVLDLGCGEGVLALLKRKGVCLAGIDLSPRFAALARSNGYDALVGQLIQLPFADAAFDYVVSLDVLGHIGFGDKDAVLSEIRRVLRPDGVTMHGIECLNRNLHGDYVSMSKEKLVQFVSIDGHVGLEVEEDIDARFSKFFSSVQSEPRYTLCLSTAEFIKQHDQYGVPFERDFIDYLRSLSFSERQAFDMAMGYVFGKISDLHIKLPKSGLYMFLKASNVPPGPFYNAHRDRRDLLPSFHNKSKADVVCLDRDSRTVFESGWYPANDLPPIARWISERARLRFEAGSLSKISLDLTTHIPNLKSQPLCLKFFLNGLCICAFYLMRYGWLELRIDVPPLMRKDRSTDNCVFELEVHSDRTWQPSAVNRESRDDRELSVAICNLQVYP
jgi:SAM-dependent methyltransferase